MPTADSDGEALGLRLGERRRPRPREQAARRALGHRIGREREPAGHLAQHDPPEALRVVLAQPGERLHDLALGDLGGTGQLGDPQRLGRQEEQRLDDARELVHSVTSARADTVIGENGSFCCQSASPAL